MLRLTVKSDTPRQVVLEVDGRISGRNVALLESEGRAVLQMDEVYPVNWTTTWVK